MPRQAVPDPDGQLAEVRLLAERFAARPGGLLPLLHAVQDEWGYIDDAFVPVIAQELNLSRADVHGVLTFYVDFLRKPAGRHVVKLCRAEACQARGAVEVEAALVARLGVGMGQTAGDGAITLEPVYCLGLCAVGPAAMVDDKPMARLDLDRIEQIARAVSA